jgi:hypothetical protein
VELTKRVRELEAELDRQRAKVAEEVARLRGLEAELGSLRAGLDAGGDLVGMSRTDAIVAVLRSGPGSMSPSEIRAALEAAGRTDDLRSITATLDHLLKTGVVQRPARGRYVAA